MCTKCSGGLHQECSYDYHRVVHGVILADEYELNKVRGSHKALKKIPNGSARIRYYRVSKDLRDGYSCESEGSQAERKTADEPVPPRADQVAYASFGDESGSGESCDHHSEQEEA